MSKKSRNVRFSDRPHGLYNIKIKYFIVGTILAILVFIYYIFFLHNPIPTNSIKKTEFKSIPTKEFASISDAVENAENAAKFDSTLDSILIERVPGSEGNRIVQEVIRDEMRACGWHVTEDRFSDTPPNHSTREFTNLIATLNPRAPYKLVLACHFDSKLFDFKFVGATDSAVPCTMMLQLARLLNGSLWAGNGDQKRDTTLQFIFFDGEEAFGEWRPNDSIYGARHLAARWEREKSQIDRETKVSTLKTIKLFVLLDLIGHLGTSFSVFYSHNQVKDNQVKPKTHYVHLHKTEKNLKDFLVKTPIKLFDRPNQINYGMIEDDHIPFLQRGVPILHLISVPFPAQWHKGFDDKDHLHTPTINNLMKILCVYISEYFHLSFQIK